MKPAHLYIAPELELPVTCVFPPGHTYSLIGGVLPPAIWLATLHNQACICQRTICVSTHQ